MIYGILLAAGTSSRMGQPKPLLNWRGKSLVRHTAEQALASRITGLVVVLGAGARDVRAALIGLDGPVHLVENPAYADGQAGSVRAGLTALPSAASGAIVLLVDQPLVGPAVINQLIDTFAAHPETLAVVPTYQGRRGNPVLLARALFEPISRISGDSGARAVFAAYADQILTLELNDPAIVTDIDTPEEYAQLTRND
jgi:molybdenum cofactor cytidylyltransferase